MANQTEIKQLARKLFDQQQEFIQQVPKIDRENLRLSIFLSVQTSLELTKLLMTTGNTAQVNGVIDELSELMRDSLPKIHVTVRSAIELTIADKLKITQFLETELNKEISLQTIVDPTILGGLTIEYSGHVIDLTVNEKLTLLKQHLK